MSSGLTHRFTAPYALSILNTIYAIFLGLLFTFFFNVSPNADTQQPEVKFMLTSQNWIPVCLIAAYFILDWFTTNVTINIFGELNHLLLIGVTLLIVYLGSMVILAFDFKSTALYLMFATYATLVTVYDFFLSKLPIVKEHRLCYLAIHTVTIFRLVIGLIMLLPLLLTWLFRNEETATAAQRNFMSLMIFLYVLVKFARYFLYTDFVARELVERGQC